jgi:hypothetical protein
MGRDKQQTLAEQVRAMKRVIGGIGQSITDMHDLFQGKHGEFGQIIYRLQLTVSSLLELLQVDDAKLSEVYNRRFAENEAKAKAAHEAAIKRREEAMGLKETEAEEQGEDTPAEVVN